MNDQRTPPAAHSGLDIAQEFIRAVEAKDIEAVARTLADDARQLFMHAQGATTPDGVAAIVTGRKRGLCVADVKGKSEVLAYTSALFDKFTPLLWRDHAWHVSPEGGELFFHGVGDMVVARTGRPYRNTYVTRFDIENGRIVLMAEYGNALMYAGLGVRPNGAEFRALLRAVGRMLSPRLSARSGR
ncbi:nuclear transport factor 2 family protein [Nocardiopsis sp. MG754419]|uniref:nuclear transport factor 2 family protein n=1 Tax=Nocardiopsis sp. MG754419 TaxID=2259865 RepID=UPI001BAA1C73|nr:nuclear transport factor 2 family protein [Nocardiopsis sp. MG754419]MBR8742632.1 nuclear transport factor 2 family protein [Nocardiopsis sp. MG754419]